MDKISKEARSRNMANIKSKDTGPELLLRRSIFSHGFRYRIHHKIEGISLDIAFPKTKKAINIHGCFWHQHENCREASKPKSNSRMWETKLKKNKERDERNMRKLSEIGWKVLIVWECELEKTTDSKVAEVINFIKS